MGRYGVFAVADVTVALPLTQLREVIPAPTGYAALLAESPGLVGAVNLRHQMIPVVDLERALGRDGTGRPDVVVIVLHEEHLFGVLASGVRDVVEVEEARTFELEAGGVGRVLFRRSFEYGEDIVCVLDSAAVRALPGMPVVRALPVATETVRTAGDRSMLMLLRCERIGMCIEVAHVHSVIPELMLKSSALDGTVVRGVVVVDDHEVPVVDPMMLLGFGALPPEASRGVALRCARGIVVLAVSDVVRIVPVDPAARLPLPEGTASPIVTGLVSGQEGGPYLFIDGAVAARDRDLDALAALSVPVDTPDGPPGRAGSGSRVGSVAAAKVSTARDVDPEGRVVIPSDRKFLTYRVGGEVATPLEQIEEILAYPPELVPVERGRPGVLGVFVHRTAAVPLTCLATLSGARTAVDPASARVLLVGGIGFLVPQLHAIENAVWEEEPGAPPPAARPLFRNAMVGVGAGATARMLPYVDLVRLAAGA
jgi:purine-binding chemotaxis protein CheW